MFYTNYISLSSSLAAKEIDNDENEDDDDDNDNNIWKAEEWQMQKI